MKKFSILIPAYNAESFILDNLNSLKNQTYTNWEAIIVNDGSTDKTLEVINSFKNDNPTLDIKVISIVNGGLANARNVAFNESSGEFFCNLDADDFFEPEALEKLAEACSTEICDIYYYDIIDFYESTNTKVNFSERFWKPDRTLTGVDGAIFKLQRKIWICQGVAFYRKKFIESIGLKNIPGINQGEDMYFITAALSQAKSVKYIDYSGTNIRYRQDSMMHAKFNESYLQAVDAIDSLKHFIQSKDIRASKKRILIDLISRERILQELRIDKSICDSCSSLKEINKTLSLLKQYSSKNSKPDNKVLTLLDRSHKIQYYLSRFIPVGLLFMTKIYRYLK